MISFLVLRYQSVLESEYVSASFPLQRRSYLGMPSRSQRQDSHIRGLFRQPPYGAVVSNHDFRVKTERSIEVRDATSLYFI